MVGRPHLVVVVVTGERRQRRLPTENQLRTNSPRNPLLTSAQTLEPVTAGKRKPVAERRQAMMAMVLSERLNPVVMMGTRRKEESM